MDENAKQIVASNLTTAYCTRHPEADDYEEIIEVYRRFLELLTPEKKDRYDPDDSQSYSQQNG